MFQEIDHELLKTIVNASKLHEYQPLEDINKILTKEDFIVVLTGKIHLYFENQKQEHYKIFAIEPGGALLLETLLESNIHTISAITQTETLLIKIPMRLINGLLTNQPTLQRNLIQSFQKNLMSSYEELTKQLKSTSD